MKTVRVDSLLDVLKEEIGETPFEIDERWLLVADLQGCEMDALISCGEYLDKFGMVYLEVNTKSVYEGCALKNEIEDYLAKHNFVTIEEFIYEHWGWGDQIFLKKSLLHNN